MEGLGSEPSSFPAAKRWLGSGVWIAAGGGLVMRRSTRLLLETDQEKQDIDDEVNGDTHDK